LKILFLHGWHSVPGGVKPTYLKNHGHHVINPALDDDDFIAAVATAQAEFDQHQPQVVVGSSRGGAVAMNIHSGLAKLVLLCPAWKNWGTARTVKAGTVLLHSRADDVIPFADSEELATNSGAMLIEVGSDHRLADPDPLEMMLAMCELPSQGPHFGVRRPGHVYVERLAAYAVVFGAGGTVAVVRGPSGRYWLPGGGSLPGESGEQTIMREVREELAMGITIIERIGEATQFFHAADEDRHYRMRASFFLAQLADKLTTRAEHELCWLPLRQSRNAFYHECHVWAVDRATRHRERGNWA